MPKEVLVVARAAFGIAFEIRDELKGTGDSVSVLTAYDRRRAQEDGIDLGKTCSRVASSTIR